MNYEVFYDLKTSSVIYEGAGLIFYFSSEVSKNSFLRKLEDFKKDRTSKLTAYYECKGNFENMLLLSLYKRCENRGFYVTTTDGVILENYTIDTVVNIN